MKKVVQECRGKGNWIRGRCGGNMPKRGEVQEEEDVIPNFEIGDDNDDANGLEYEYENDNEMTEDEVLQRLWTFKI